MKIKRKKNTTKVKVKVKVHKEKKTITIKRMKQKGEISAFRPMLAQTFDITLYEDKKKKKARIFLFTFPVFVQRKLDGIRCVSHINNKNDIIMSSRNGIEIHNFVKIKEEISSLYEDGKVGKQLYFDGELFTTKMKFEDINGMVRREKKDSVLVDAMEYHIYDVYDPDNKKWSFEERNLFLINININRKKKNNDNKIQFVTSDTANNMEEITQFQEQYIAEGYEGIMIRERSGAYEENKRSKYLQKYKLFMEEEFPIVGFRSGDVEGNEKDCVIWECNTIEGKQFSVRPRGTVEEKRKLYKDGAEYIGKLLTVIFQEYTKDGIPRFPVGKAIRDANF
jgi:ATP-dependent DNA ligase